jgi:uncharacterized protein (TIGR03435 family)
MRHLASIIIVVLVLTSVGTRGQTSGDPGIAKFEAVSIKPSQAAAGGSFGMRPGGSLLMDDGLLSPLIALAYGVKSFQIVDAPSWTARERFTIRTSATGNPTSAQARVMLQRMLADRFQLLVHNEQRIATVHALTLARSDGKLGPHLTLRTPPCEPGSRVSLSDVPPEIRRGLPTGLTTAPCGSTLLAGGDRMAGVGMTIGALAQAIEGYWLNEHVVDRTGLTGGFDILIENMVNQWSNRGPSVDAAPSDAGPLQAALQEQPGLRIEARREPIDVLVIDRIERPSPD